MADVNKEIPANTNPPPKLPVRLLIAPIAYGPTKLPRFPTELMRAIPAYARQQPELLARDSQLFVHGQRREASVDSVNGVSHEQNEDERNDVCFQLADCCGFNTASSDCWTGCHAHLTSRCRDDQRRSSPSDSQEK